MNKEEWLINEVNKWQDDSLINNETGEKIKAQYELFRKFPDNIFPVLFAILGAVLMIVGGSLAAFYSWPKLTSVTKVIVIVAPLILSYILSIYTILFKTNNKIWKEISAILNVVAMFLALGVIVSSFHIRMTLSQYLIISTVLTVPIMYIMQAVSPLILYYIAVFIWGSCNISMGSAPILLLLFLLGVGLIVFNIKTINKVLKYNVTVCAIAGLPFMILLVKMLNGDLVLGAFLYSTLLFAARDIKRHYFPFKLLAMIVSLISVIYITTSYAWNPIDGKYGGIILGIITGIVLLASLALEVFNTKENTYEFSYLLLLMGVSIYRYIWGCIHSRSFLSQMIFMGIAIAIAVFVALGFVSLGKSKKRMSMALVGFGILGITILIKIFETNLFFLGRALAFLGLGCVSLIVVVILSGLNKNDENNEVLNTSEENKDETAEEIAEETEEQESDDGGQVNEEDNIVD